MLITSDQTCCLGKACVLCLSSSLLNLPTKAARSGILTGEGSIVCLGIDCEFFLYTAEPCIHKDDSCMTAYMIAYHCSSILEGTPEIGPQWGTYSQNHQGMPVWDLSGRVARTGHTGSPARPVTAQAVKVQASEHR